MTNLNSIIGKRLQDEIRRRDVSIAFISETTGMEQNEVDRVLSGAADTNLTNLHRICNSLSLNIFRVMAQEYKPCTIHYRGLSPAARNFVSDLEDAFLLAADLFPKPRPPRVKIPDRTDLDYQYLIASVCNSINWVKGQLGSDPYEMLNEIKIPVFPVYFDPEEFDACLLSSKPYYAICVNQATSPARILFSLLHELAHFFFDRDKETSVEVWRFNAYKKQVDVNDVPEFLATKFAQYFLIPFEAAETLWRSVNKKELSLDTSLAQEIIDSSSASREVLANALFDMSRIFKDEISYTLIRDTLLNSVSPAQNAAAANFLLEKKRQIEDILFQHEDDFSDEVFDDIKETFRLQRRILS